MVTGCATAPATTAASAEAETAPAPKDALDQLAAKWDAAYVFLGTNYLGNQQSYQKQLEKIVTVVRVDESGPFTRLHHNNEESYPKDQESTGRLRPYGRDT